MSVQRDIDAELRFHLDARIEELVGQGMNRDAARRQAMAEFGDVDAVRADLRAIDRRVARKRSRMEALHGFWQDAAYAVRSLRRSPAVSLTIVVTLALGLGANAAMFSLLDVIFLRPPSGVSSPETLRRVWSQRRYSSGVDFSLGYDYAGYAAIARAVDGQAEAAYYRSPETQKMGRGESAPRVAVSAASANYFTVLGLHPRIGRFFSVDETRVDTIAPVAVISDALWHREFDARTSVLGEQITMNNRRFTIIGVAAPGFTGVELDATEAWITPSAAVGQSGGRPWWENPNENGFRVLLRLTPDARGRELEQRIAVALRAPGIGFRPDTAPVVALGSIIRARGPASMKTDLKVATRTAGVALIVLVIALANVVNLLLARAVKRRREIAVRLALGISRARLVRMLVTESVLLAVAASVASIGAAVWGGAMLRTLLMPDTHFAETPLHGRVLVFALGIAVVIGALAGLIPALQSASPDLANSLKSGSRDGTRHRSRLRSALVVAQSALSVLLMVGAVLFVRSLNNVKGHDIGITVDKLLFAGVSYDVRDSARDAATPARLRSLAPRVAAIPGVERVAYTHMRPKWGFSWADSWYPDVDTIGRKKPTAFVNGVSPGYFSTIGTRLLRGRDFRASDAAGPHAVIVNEAMARAVWQDADPIGRCVRFDRPDAPCATVIGVVQTMLFTSIKEKPEPQFYLLSDHSPTRLFPGMQLVVRATRSRLPAIQKAIGDLLRAEFPGAAPTLATMAHEMEPEYRPWRLGATLFTLFGVLALLVASIGIHSTVSYAVSQRTHEFGVRIALGAQTRDVLRQVLSEGLTTVAAGVVLGILMALAAGRIVASLLYDVGARDPMALSLVAALLLVVAAIAAFRPAWRASRADPVAALRAD